MLKKRIRQSNTLVDDVIDCKTKKLVNRLFILDKPTTKRFLIDTGADVSLIPPVVKPTKCNFEQNIFAANGTHIKTFGTKRLTLNLGLRRSFTWNFIIADVQMSILGADFLKNYNLLIDMKKNRLIDGTTQISVATTTNSIPVCEIKSFDVKNPFAHLLNEFTEITMFNRSNTQTKSSTMHHIETKGSPSFARARKLSADKLKIAKQEFQYLIEQGIYRPSKSNWSSSHCQESQWRMENLWRLQKFKFKNNS